MYDGLIVSSEEGWPETPDVSVPRCEGRGGWHGCDNVAVLTVRGKTLRVAVRAGDQAGPPLLLCNGISAFT